MSQTRRASTNFRRSDGSKLSESKSEIANISKLHGSVL